jgi:hypothetical protein
VRPAGKLDLAAPGRRGTRPDAAADFRHHDARSGLAAQLACLVDGLFERHLDAVRELVEGFGQRLGLDLEAERQHAGGGEQLGLSRVQHRARGIG